MEIFFCLSISGSIKEKKILCSQSLQLSSKPGRLWLPSPSFPTCVKPRDPPQVKAQDALSSLPSTCPALDVPIVLHLPQDPLGPSEPYSPKKLRPLPPPSWAFGSVCCFPCLLSLAPSRHKYCKYLHVITTATGKAAWAWIRGAKQRSVSVLVPLGTSRQVKMQTYSIKRASTILARWHQQAATRNVRCPPWLSLPCWKMEDGREMSEKATVFSHQNSAAFFFIEQYPSYWKILD